VNTEKKNLTYRHTVSPGDRETVREIVISTGFFSEAEVEIAVELVAERLEKGLDSGYHFIFAEQDGRTVGYACFGPIPATRFSFDLYWIVVHADWRGLGIGRAIMAECQDAIRKLGGRRVYAETSGRDQYQPTRNFYIACGYREEAILEHFYAPGDAKCFYVKVI
jgi:D-alanine-D-alanine ligase